MYSEQQPAFLTKTVASKTLDALGSIIDPLFTFLGTERKFIHVVIPDLDGNVLAERSFGNAPEGPGFEENCRQIARSKAQIHVRTGLPSAQVQARHPQFLCAGDAKFGGSAEHEEVVVAASGVEERNDEAISGVGASILWGLLMQARQRYMARPDTPLFYPEAG